ncbi:MAG TPA: two-component regulator propeller domain-containing protein [Rubricoccaceae bacterium]|jgi:hypothetical protein
MRHFLGLAVLVLAAASASAQTPEGETPSGDDVGSWQAYPAFTEVTAVASGLGRVWAGTTGGVFSYDPATGEIERRNAIEGLRGGPIRSVAVDERRGAVWVAYGDGALDRLTVESGEVRTFLDIERNTQFTSRTIRRLRVLGDSLYAATDFGLVVFDLGRNEVRNTYARLGSLPAATPVNDLLFAPLPDGRRGLWLATDAGIVTAFAGDPALQSPAAWTRDAGFPHRSLSLALFTDGEPTPTVHVGGGPATARDLYDRRQSGTWERRLFIGDDLTTLVADGTRLLALRDFSVLTYELPSAVTNYVPANAVGMRGLAIGPDGRVWVGDAALGLFALPARSAPGTTTPFVPDAITPAGPFSNSYADIDVAPDGTVWTASLRVPAAQTSAISRLDAETGDWTSRYTRDEPAQLGQADFVSLKTGADNSVYIGTGGDGLVVISPEGVTTRYDETNSSLRQAGSNLSFVVVSDVAFEGDDLWVVNQESLLPLHYFAPDGTSAGLPFPIGTSGGTGVSRLAVDRLGQKWLSVSGGGLIVWDTGDAPASPADDRARQYRGQGTINGGGLPGANVADVVVDGEGTVWIGTNRGIATVFSPGSVFASDPALGVPQFTLTPTRADGSREPFLRDVVVNDLDVDPGGRVWVATTSGAYLVAPDPSGSGFVTLREFNAANSPLPSDDVRRIAVRASDGRVFLTTTEGLFSVSGDATAPVAGSEALTVSPSPFRPAEAPQGVLVRGLATARSTVRVLTLAGELIHEAEAAGGSFRWDGRDDRTGDLVSSGVYIVAAVGSNGEAVVGKVAVLR